MSAAAGAIDAAAPQAKPAQDAFSRLIVTIGLMTATLMNTIDSTIANVALPHIQGSVSASQDEITWVLTSYILATAVMVPLSGWLALKIGRRPMFIGSIAAFVVASVLCGMATSLPQIVGFRLLQGLAGASLMPLTQAAMLDLWPPKMIPRVLSVWAAVVMAGPILGPTIGGYLTESLSWRWCFYINLPIGVVALAAVVLFMRGGDAGRARPFDALGYAALAIGMCAIQLMFDRGSGQDWFDSPEIWAEAILGVCALWVFAVHSATTEHPFFHPDLIRDRNFVSCWILGFFVTASAITTSALLPSFMQTLLGYSALQAGMASMSRGIGSLLSFIVVPWVTAKLGFRVTICIGLAFSIGSTWMMEGFDLSMTNEPIVVTGFLQGIGVGLTFNPMTVLSFATLDNRHRTEAAVVFNMGRSLGGSLGIAVVQGFLIRQSAAAHAALAEHISPADPIIPWASPGLFTRPGALEALNGEITRQGMMIGYNTIFAGLAVASLALLPLLLIMRPAKPQAAAPGEVHAD